MSLGTSLHISLSHAHLSPNRFMPQPSYPPNRVIPQPGHACQDGDRTLFMGWFNVGLSCLTAPRDISYEPMTGRLVAWPVPELAALRNGTLADLGPVEVAPHSDLRIFEGSLTFDLELNLTLQSAPMQFTVAVAANSATDAVAMFNVNVSSPASNGLRDVLVTGNFPGFVAPMSFRIPSTPSTPLAIRVLGDRTVAEIFVAGSAITAPLGNVKNRTGVYLQSGSSKLAVKAAKAWDMGCGWAKYP